MCRLTCIPWRHLSTYIHMKIYICVHPIDLVIGCIPIQFRFLVKSIFLTFAITMATAETFLDCGRRLMRKYQGSNIITNRRFRSTFGLSPEIASDIWNLLPRIRYGRPQHLLWAWLFLKLYSTEKINASLAGCNEKTFRKWAFCYIRLIANTNIVSPTPTTSLLNI